MFEDTGQNLVDGGRDKLKLSATGARALEDSSLSSEETSHVSEDSGAVSAESNHAKLSSGMDSSLSKTTVTHPFPLH